MGIAYFFARSFPIFTKLLNEEDGTLKFRFGGRSRTFCSSARNVKVTFLVLKFGQSLHLLLSHLYSYFLGYWMY